LFADDISVFAFLGTGVLRPNCSSRRFIYDKEERWPSIGHKRVDWAFGYALKIKTDEVLTIDVLSEWFEAGDDAWPWYSRKYRPKTSGSLHRPSASALRSRAL